MKIGLRGGHSPYCKGAIALRDEQECVRRLSYEVKKILENHGHTVIDCNSNANTEHGELSEGAYKANSNNVDYFISIHMNCCNSQAHGVEAWTYNENSRANNIARRLVDNYARIGYYKRGVKYKSSFYEMRNIKAPNIIFETLFCDNKNDVDLWAKTSWEDHASAIANAIDPNIPITYDNNSSNSKTPYIAYQAHLQGLGWQEWKRDGQTSGTTGQSRMLEALAITLHNSNADIDIQGHSADVGWQTVRNNGEVLGTVGLGRRLEALKIKIDGLNVKYRVHVAHHGWMDWVKNGEIAGTTGESRRIEAVEIKLY